MECDAESGKAGIWYGPCSPCLIGSHRGVFPTVTPATLSWSLLPGNPEKAVQCRQGGHQIDRLRSEHELTRPLDCRTTGGARQIGAVRVWRATSAAPR